MSKDKGDGEKRARKGQRKDRDGSSNPANGKSGKSDPSAKENRDPSTPRRKSTSAKDKTASAKAKDASTRKSGGTVSQKNAASSAEPGDKGEGAGGEALAPQDDDHCGHKERGLMVAVVGASAGGLDPLKRLTGGLPDDANIAFIVMQHMSPHAESRMAELLRRVTSMQVVVAEDVTRLEPSHVYTLPPGYLAAVRSGTLKLTEMDEQDLKRRPIDHLLISTAKAFKDNAIAVILTGAGSDGTSGVRAIRREGGLVIAQDRVSAPYPDMPRSAIATGLVDHVTEVDAMPGVLASYARTLKPIRRREGFPDEILNKQGAVVHPARGPVPDLGQSHRGRDRHLLRFQRGEAGGALFRGHRRNRPRTPARPGRRHARRQHQRGPLQILRHEC